MWRVSATTPKNLSFVGSAKESISQFPKDVRQDAGHQLWRVQKGLNPTKWKPFESAGAGAKEIILDDGEGWYRVIYVAKFGEVVYVLHAFQKKTNKTSKGDVDAAERAYKAVLRQRGK